MRYGGTDSSLPRTGLAFALLWLAARPTSASGPQSNLDARHSGTSLRETIIYRGNVGTLHPLYHIGTSLHEAFCRGLGPSGTSEPIKPNK
jgi:hypothetical protein